MSVEANMNTGTSDAGDVHDAVGAYQIAQAYAWFGDRDRAFQ